MIRKRLTPAAKKVDGHSLAAEHKQLVDEHNARVVALAERASERSATIDSRIGALEHEQSVVSGLLGSIAGQ